jgi:hypothetical protein
MLILARLAGDPARKEAMMTDETRRANYIDRRGGAIEAAERTR